jgi:hypothetical protein
MCFAARPSQNGAPRKKIGGVIGSVLGDIRQGGSPTFNPIKRSLDNASPEGPKTQYSPPASVTPVNQASPLANAMVGQAIAKQNPNAFANGPIKMNNSANKTGRVIS